MRIIPERDYEGIPSQVLELIRQPIDADQIVPASIITECLKNGSILTAKIGDLAVTTAKINDCAVGKLTAGTITSKAITLAVSAGTGDTKIQAGKTDFTNTESGFILGIDDSDGDKAKLYIGDSSYYLNWDGTDLTVNGATVSSSVIDGVASGSEISIQGWQQDMTFSSTDSNTVAWASGTITLLDGTTYSISGGNTGNMMSGVPHYIYLDIGESTTALQTSTTASNAVGSGKILVAVTCPTITDASSRAKYQVFGGAGGQMVGVDYIAANSASTNEFISNTAQIKDAIITNAKINDVDVGKLTAGTITADVTISNTFKTAASPNPRIEIDSSYIAGYSDATTKQFYLSSTDGKAYFGAGACWLDSSGITLKGDVLTLKDGTETYHAYIYEGGTGNLNIYNAGGNIILNPASPYRVLPYSVSVILGEEAANSQFGNIVTRVLTLEETTTPSAVTDWGKLYTKNDNKLYFQDGAGNEHEVAFA